jgi:hypothetical protein
MAQAIAAGELEGIEQGRAAVGKSAVMATYEPHPSDRWVEAVERARAWSKVAAG